MSTQRGPFWLLGGVFVAGAGLAVGGIQLVEHLTEVSPREKATLSRGQPREELDLEELRGALSSLGVETKSGEPAEVSPAPRGAPPAREDESSEEQLQADVDTGVSAAEILAELEREYRRGLQKADPHSTATGEAELASAQQRTAQLALLEPTGEAKSSTLARQEEPAEVRVATAVPTTAPAVELPRSPEPVAVASAPSAAAPSVALASTVPAVQPGEVHIHQGDVNNTTVNHTEVNNVRVVNTYSPIFFLPQQGTSSQKPSQQPENRLPSGPTYLSPWSGIDYSQHYINPWASISGR